jgi:predicted ATP-binding protein involved in virulence
MGCVTKGSVKGSSAEPTFYARLLGMPYFGAWYLVDAERAMRIDRLEIENFKKFAHQTIDLHPNFTLFVGENGAGKTTVLDALAVASAIWLVNPPDSKLTSSGRNIAATEIRLQQEVKGDRTQFREQRPVRVSATGRIGDRDQITWTRQIRASGKRTSNAEAKSALQLVSDLYTRDSLGQSVLSPVLAYYGAGRAWLASNQRVPLTKGGGPARRWAAFYDCFNERIRFAELQRWFSRETTERGNRGGLWRPGFEVVRRAILGCVPEADGVWFDTDLDQIVLSIRGSAQPFDNLSAGQRMMLALVADIAIKAVTQNAYLLPRERLGPGHPTVLTETPGLVLIDELDVHLHPKWQRRVATDLKRTFPSIQFACTSHSPQVIGEVEPGEIRSLDGLEITTPSRSFGIDSSRVLEELMDAPSRNQSVEDQLSNLFKLIDDENLAGARVLLPEIEATLGTDDPEITRAKALMSFLETSA